MDLSEYKCCDAASLLRQYSISLSGPATPSNFYDGFVESRNRAMTQKDKAAGYKRLMVLLSPNDHCVLLCFPESQLRSLV